MLFPHTQTRRTRLRLIEPVPPGAVGDLLRKEGLEGIPGFDTYVTTQSGDINDIAAQFVVEQPDTGESVGFGELSNLDRQRGEIRVDILTDPDRTPHGIALEVTVLVVNYAFAGWDVGKTYFCATGEKVETLKKLPAIFEEEPRKPKHLSDIELPYQIYVLAIQRERWEKYGTRFLERLTRNPLDH